MSTELEHLRERNRELEENQRRLVLLYDSIADVIFHLAETRFPVPSRVRRTA
jgi:hypothetical protein